jgi:Flp pilus assembly protein TadB
MLSAERWQTLLIVVGSLAALAVLATALRLSALRIGARRRARAADEVELPGRTERMLRAAGFAVPPLVFHAFSLLLAGLVGLWAVEIAGGLLFVGLLVMLGTLYLIHSSVLEAGRRRTLRLEEKLADAIDTMAATLRGSDNPRAALAGAAEVSPAPVGPELREVVRRLELGMPIARALLKLRSDHDCEGVRLFTSALSAKWTAGGDLAPTLTAVNKVIRERLRHRLRVRSRLAGANVASWMAGLSPYLVFAAMWYFNADWIRRLFAHPQGPMLFIGAVALQLVGFLWLRRLMRSEL